MFPAILLQTAGALTEPLSLTPQTPAGHMCWSGASLPADHLHHWYWRQWKTGVVPVRPPRSLLFLGTPDFTSVCPSQLLSLLTLIPSPDVGVLGHIEPSHHNCVKFNHFTKFCICDTYWIFCCDWTPTSIPSIPFGLLLTDLEFGATDVAVNDILSWQKKQKWETFSICIKSNWRKKSLIGTKGIKYMNNYIKHMSFIKWVWRPPYNLYSTCHMV